MTKLFENQRVSAENSVNTFKYKEFFSLAEFERHIQENPHATERGIVRLDKEGPNTTGFVGVYFRREGVAYKANTNGSRNCPIYYVLNNQGFEVEDLLARVRSPNFSFSQNQQLFSAAAAKARSVNATELRERFEGALEARLSARTGMSL